MRYLYLHGFASGPQSRKAQAFRSQLVTQGIDLELPELDGGDFEHLTLSGQLKIIERTLDNQPARIVGSSMGGYLAALYASTHPEVDRVVLLAPAFSFASRWGDLLPTEQLESWRASGWLSVYHYGAQTMRRLHYGLYEDALKYPPFPNFNQPALIFHGIADTVAPIELSRTFAAHHPNVRLTEFDSDHELLNVVRRIAFESTPFLTGWNYKWLNSAYQLGDRAADPDRAARLLNENPALAAEYPFAVGETSAFSTTTPPFGMPPLIAVTFSSLIRLERFAPALRRAAQYLLDGGADPNQTWTNPDFPQWPLSALYGATGLNHDAEMTRLLLERGANPNDGESLYHSLEGPDLACTRLLLEHGADPKAANAVAHILDYDNLEGLRMILAHGGEPRLEHALRRRRSTAHIQALLDAGAPTEGAYRAAMLAGLPEQAALLPPEPLTDTDQFLTAFARADRAEVERMLAEKPNPIASLDQTQLRHLPDLAWAGQTEAVKLMVELGWPIDIRGGDIDGTALNCAVFHGDADLTRFLLAHGADWRVPHCYNDNVMGTLSFTSERPGALACAQALIEGGMPVPGERYRFSSEITAYFQSLK